IDEIREHDVGASRPQRLRRHRHALRIRAGVDRIGYPSAGKDVNDLSDAKHRSAGRHDSVQPGFPRRPAGEVAPVGRSREVSFARVEWTCDDAADQMLAGEESSGVSAEIPEFFRWPDFFMTGDLENRVARRVEDGPPGRQMLGTKFRDDFGAGRGPIARDRLARITLESHDELRPE